MLYRDHGIPDYNTVRQSFQLPPKTSFSDITSDLYLQEKLQEIYGSVDKVENNLELSKLNLCMSNSTKDIYTYKCML